MKTKMTYIIILLTTSVSGFSQIVIDRQLISPWGMTAQTGEVKMDASIGEIFIGGTPKMNIGFQQPVDQGTTAVGEFSGKEFDYSFYPNPVDQVLNFTWSLLTVDQAWLELYSADGRLRIRKKLDMVNGRYSINLEDLASGMLAARIYDEKQQTILTQLIIKQ